MRGRDRARATPNHDENDLESLDDTDDLHRIRGQVLRVFVPKGRNDRSQAIYCLERAIQRTRPVGNGMIRSTGRFSMGGEYVV